MKPDKKRQSPEGMTVDDDGKITDADFHERQMGLTTDVEEELGEMASNMRLELLETQARQAEGVDVSFAIKAYHALVEMFPDADSAKVLAWKEKITSLTRIED